MYKIFIDGSAGTTGLRIYDRLSVRKDIELIILSDELRKDLGARKEAINKSLLFLLFRELSFNWNSVILLCSDSSNVFIITLIAALD